MTRRVVWPIGLVAVLAAFWIGLVALRGAPPAWLRLSSDGFVHARPHTILLAVLLLLLGWGMARRRIVALGTTVLLLAAVAVAVHHIDYSLALLAIAAGLTMAHARWTTVPDRQQVYAAVRNGLLTAGAAVVFDIAAHLHLVPTLDPGSASLAAILVGLGTALRAAPAPQPSGPDDRARVRRMVAAEGADTLAPFALRSDKTYLFSTDGTAAVGYRVLLGVAVVGGDPVGDPAGFADVVARFRQLCDRKGWRPAVLGARDDLVTLWGDMRRVGIGDEVVLDAPAFSLATRRMRNVRQAVRRTHNAGVRTTLVRAADIPAGLRAELAALSRQWLGRNRERGFSMILDGLFDDAHPAGLFVLAFDPADRLVGFQRYLPVGESAADWALSLDVMRRTKDRLNGLNERMIVDVVEYAREHGARRVSLNFAAFRALLDRPTADRTPLDRLAYRLVHLLDPLIQVESLYLFNAKFRPGYVARTVLLGSWLALPIVLLALLGLEFALPYDRGRHAATATAPDRVPDETPAGHVLPPCG